MAELLFSNDDAVPFKIPVGFVMGEVEFVLFRGNVDGVSSCYFAPIVDRFVIWKSEFS